MTRRVGVGVAAGVGLALVVLAPTARPQPGGGKGGPGGRGGGGVSPDPLVGLNDASKPLRSKILAVPALRAKYLANVKAIAEKSLDWNALGPVVAKYRGLIDKDVEADTRKPDTAEAFRRATAAAAGCPCGSSPTSGGSSCSTTPSRRPPRSRNAAPGCPHPHLRPGERWPITADSAAKLYSQSPI